MKEFNKIYIGGKFTTPHGSEKAEIISPLDGKVIGRVTYADQEDTKRAILAAKMALESYSKTTLQERANYLQRIHDEIMKRIDELIEATVVEYGAPLERAKWSNVLSATTFTGYIPLLQSFEFERQVSESKVIMEPVGVSALFTPWNSSSGSIAVKIAPALATGCTVILKPSEFSPWQSQLIMEAIDAAGLPVGVVNMVNGRGEVISRALMGSPEVTKIAFTGSTAIGKVIAAQALDTMKRVTLELGGKSANIILDDADLDTAVPRAIQAAFMNNGQACIAGTRLLVHESILEEVKTRIVKVAEDFKVGDPRQQDVKIGPLASQRQYDRIQQAISKGIEEGAELIFGGLGKPEGLEEGFYVRPTIFWGVNNNMWIARNEIFGPVLSVIAYRDDYQAVAIANDSPYGLMAFISSTNKERANRIADKLKAGRVLINTLKHDPIAPFGGYKDSGLGRENGTYGMEEFLEPKVLITE